MRALVPLAGLIGCAPSVPDLPLTVLVRGEDGTYALAPRDLPELGDPFHVTGEVATGFRGGSLQVVFADVLRVEYREGAKLRVRWFEADGALVPADEDGLVIWSFYAHLTDIRRELDAHGYDLDPIFPVRFAYQPITPQDFLAVENAGYVAGTRTFVLFPDGLEGVPLAGNAGVVRHELAHAWFELLVLGGADAPVETPTDATNSIRALNEGFADTVAALTLDDPGFIEPSLRLPERNLETDWVATPETYPGPDDTGLFAYDPYVLGTVYASLVWSVREATGDRWATLELAVAAVTLWGAQAGEGASWSDTDRYVQNLVDLADAPTHDAVCAAAAVHLPDEALVGC